MKSNLRKALALLLTLIMVMTSLPTSALAEAVADLTNSVTDVSEGKQLFGEDFVSPQSIAVDVDANSYITYKFVVDGAELTDAEQIVKNGDTLYEPAAPEKDGYKFVGWFNGETKFTAFGAQSGITATGEVTLTASFAEAHYVFFMDQNNRVFETREGTNGTEIQADATFPVSTEEGITGWYTDADLTNRVDSVTIDNANITLYPKVEKGHWITFDSAEGTYVKPAFYLPGDKTVAPGDVTKPGYTFAGWYKDETEFTFGAPLEESITLKAKWTANTNTKYTVIYWQENANYQNPYLAEDKQDKNQYAFAESEVKTGTTGAQTSATASKRYTGFTAQTVEQKTIKGDGSTIVNVYYNRNEYSVKFYNNSRTEYTSLRITAKYGAKIGSKWPTYNGSNTWATSRNGNTYQVNIDTMPLNGASFYGPKTGRGSETAYYYVEVLPGETGTETKNGVSYKLDHSDTSPGTNYIVTQEDKYDIEGFTYKEGTSNSSSYNNAKFYYTRNSYDIVFMNNGAKDKTVTKKYEQTISDANYTPSVPATLKGYSFGGWYDNELGEGEAFKFEGTMPARNITLYARWDPPTVSGAAHKVMAGGDNPTELTIAYGGTVNQDDLPTPTAPEGDGWDFVCWATKDDDGNFTPFNFDTIIYEDIVLYPYYVNSTALTITYDVNGDTSMVADARKYAINAYADVFAAPTAAAPAGKVFLGWNTQADGLGTMYQPGDKVKMESDVTLYAIWGDQAGTTSLTYHSNYDPDDTFIDSNIRNNASVTVKAYGDTGLTDRQGYTFAGWATSADATTANVGKTIRVDSNGSNDLYAIWTANTDTPYTVEYYWQNVDDDKFTLHETVDKTGTTGETVTAEQKTYEGFTLDTSVEGTRLTGAIAADGTLVLKLYYIRNTYTVIFNQGAHGHLTGEDSDGNVVHANLKYGSATPTAPAVNPDAGYTFNGVWSPAIANTVTGDATYVAQYAEAGDVTIRYIVDPANGGTVSRDSQSLAPATGVAEEVTAAANAGWKFTGWTLQEDASYSSSSEKMTPAKADDNGSTIWTNRTYVAHFERLTGTLTVEKKVEADQNWKVDFADEEFSFTLTGEGKNETFTLKAGQKKEFTDLPYGNYKIKETKKTGWTAVADVDVPFGQPAQTVTITNTPEKDGGDVVVQKVWLDENEADRPETLSLVYRGTVNGTTVYEYPVTLTAEGDWELTIPANALPTKYNGNEITYDLVETAVPENYVQKADADPKTVTNVRSGDVEGITFFKQWDDDENVANYRLSADDFKALLTLTRSVASGTSEPVDAEPTITGDGSTWTIAYGTLPQYDANGKAYTYRLTEAAVDNYTTEQATVGVNETIVNKLNVGTLTITKALFGIASTTDEFTVAVKRDGKTVATVTLKTGEMSQTLTLPIGEYTVEETEIKGQNGGHTEYWYEKPEAASVTVAAGQETKVTLTNTVEMTTVEGEKTWKDDGNKLNTRPESITINLLRDGTKIDSQTVSADGEWKWSFANLPAKNPEDGRNYAYTITEETVTDYTAAVDGYDVTNTLTGEYDENEVAFTKEWNDQSNAFALRPAVNSNEVTFELERSVDGENWSFVGSAWTITDNADDTWTIAYSAKLPKYDGNGVKYAYRIVETKNNKAYTAVKNTAVFDTDDKLNNQLVTASLTVKKVWFGAAQSAATVTVSESGRNVQTLTLNADNEWTQTITLPKQGKDGKLYNYKVEETPITGYSTYYTVDSDAPATDAQAITLAENKTVTVTNVEMKEVTVNKVWVRTPESEWKIVSAVLEYTDPMTNNPKATSFWLAEENGWSVKVPVPVNSEGELVDYTVEETQIGGKAIENFKPTYSYSADKMTATITNTYEEGVTSVNVIKTWERPVYFESVGATATFTLKRSTDGTTWEDAKTIDGSAVAAKTSTEGETWKKTEGLTFTNLPLYDENGATYRYKVVETMSADYGYTADAAEKEATNGTASFTNTKTADAKLTIAKVAKDVSGNEITGDDAPVFTFDIKRGNAVVTTAKIKAGESETLVGLVPGEYTVEETGVNSNVWTTSSDKTTVTASAEGETITFTNTRVARDITVTKDWVDGENKYETRADATFMLEQSTDGEKWPLVAAKSTQDTATFTVPAYTLDGTKIQYRVTESGVPSGYTVDSVTKTVTDTNALTFTNTLKMNVKVTKTWETNGVDVTLTPGLTITLYDGDQTIDTKAMQPGQTQVVFENVPYSESYTVGESNLTGGTISYVNAAGDTVVGTAADYFTLSDAQEAAAMPDAGKLTVVNATAEFTNTATVGAIKVSKQVNLNNTDWTGAYPTFKFGVTWVDDEDNTHEVKLNLQPTAENTPVVSGQILVPLDKEVTVTETPVTGWTAEAPKTAAAAETVQTVSFINNRETTEISGKKIWIGGEEESIQLFVRRNGEKLNEQPLTVTPDETGSFTIDAVNGKALAQRDQQGNAYTYTLEEQRMPNYTTTYSADTLTITNTHTATLTVVKTGDIGDELFEMAIAVNGKELMGDAIGLNGSLTTEGAESGATHTITETQKTGWYLKQVTVERNEQTEAADVDGTSVNVVMEPNDNVVVTFENQPQTGSLTVNKTDVDGNKVVGAKFALEGADGNIAYEATTDQNGVATFSGVAIGSYTLKETEAPTGYVRSEETHAVAVTGNDTNTVAADVTIDGTNTAKSLTVTNAYALNSFTLKKTVVDETWAADANAEFTFTVAFENDAHKTYTVALGDQQQPAVNGKTEMEVTLKHGESAVFTGLPYGTTVTVTEKVNANTWKTTWTGASSANGLTATANVKADAIEVTATNTRVTTDDEEREIELVKNWNDEGFEAYRPTSITIELFAKSGSASYATTNLTQERRTPDYSGVIDEIGGKKLAMYDLDGNEYQYELREIKIGTHNVVNGTAQGYRYTQDSCDGTKTVITNAIVPTSIAVTKAWDDVREDVQNFFGLRPDTDDFASKVSLYSSVDSTKWTKLNNATATVAETDAADTYTVTFSNLPQFDKDGNEIQYRVTESTVEHYEALLPQDATSVTETLKGVANGQTITNRLESGALIIEKTVNANGVEPDGTVTFEFTVTSESGATITRTLTFDLSETDKLTKSVRIDGLPYGIYTVAEKGNDAWTTTVAGEKSGNAEVNLQSDSPLTVSFTNTRNLFNDNGEITVEKTWVRIGDEAYPNTTFSLMQKLGNEEATASQTLTLRGADVDASGKVSGKFENVPKYAPDGEAYAYEVVEAEVPGYTTARKGDNENGWKFTNTQVPAGAVSVTKNWNDLNDKFGLRPDEVAFKSYVSLARSTDGKTWRLFNWEKTVVKTSDNQYTVTFSGMPEKDADGNAYSYRVVEKAAPDEYYTATGADALTLNGTTWVYAENGGTLTNTLKTGKLVIEKKVAGYVGDAFAAGATEATLDFDYTITRAQDDASEVNLDSVKNQTLTVKLTKTDDGVTATQPSVEIELPLGSYQVSENDCDAWTVSISYGDAEPVISTTPGTSPAHNPGALATVNGEKAEKLVFTNTRRMFNGDGEYTVVKNWVTVDGEAYPNVTITLQANGADYRSVELKGEDSTISHTFTDLPEYDLSGTKLSYTAAESTVDGYTPGDAVYSKSDEMKAEDDTATFTNTQNTFGIQVKKTWLDGAGNPYTDELPEKLEVTLNRGNAKYGDTITLTAANGWAATLTDLPTHDANGNEYTYTLTEKPVDGFAADASVLKISELPITETTDSKLVYVAEFVNRKTEGTPVTPEKEVTKADYVNVTFDDGTTKQMVENGSWLTYTISYYNHLSVPATITITDVLNENLEFYPSQNPGAEYNEADRTVTWEIGNVAPCSGGTVTLTVLVQLVGQTVSSSDPKVSNTASVKIGNNPAQETIPAEVTVYNPNLRVVKTVTNTPSGRDFVLGETVQFKIVVTNNGNVPLTDVTLTDGMSGIADQAVSDVKILDGEGYTVDGKNVDIGTMNPGDEVVIKAEYTVISGDLGKKDELSNTASATATPPKGDPLKPSGTAYFDTDDATQLSVRKIWQGVDEFTRPERIGVQLMVRKSGETVWKAYDLEGAAGRYSSPLTLTKANAVDENTWFATLFEQLPVRDADGNSYEYSVAETSVDGISAVNGKINGYDVAVATKTEDDLPVAEITNTLRTRDITVAKRWTDGEGNALDEKLIQNVELTIELSGLHYTAEGGKTEVLGTVTLSKANNWTAKFENLPVYDKEGNAIAYTIHEVGETDGQITLTDTVDGESRAVTYDVTYSWDGDNARVTNARVSDDPEQNQPTKEANLADGKNTVSVDETFVYTISYHNSLNTKANVTITDVLDEGLTFVKADNDGSYDSETRTVTWALENVAPFADGAVTLTVKVNEAARKDDDAATVKNKATVVIPDNEAEIRYDTNEVEIPVTPDDPTAPTKKPVGIDPAKDTVKVGQQVEYQIGYTNHKNTAVSVKITDALDQGVKFVLARNGGVYDAATHTVTWNIDKVAPFTDGYVTLTVEVTEAARKLDDGETVATVKNSADVKIGNDKDVETNVVDIPVKPDDPKKPEKKANVAAGTTVKVGDEIEYTISYKNHLNTKANVVVTDKLDEGVDFVAAENGTYDAATHTVTWTFENVEPYQGGEVKLTVKVNENAKKITADESTATVDNTASVKVGNDYTSESDPVEIPVTPDDPKKPEKKANVAEGATVKVGDEIEYTISYKNHLNTKANVVVTDKLDEGVDFVAAENGTYDAATHTVTWTFENVAPYDGGEVKLTVKVNENAKKITADETTATVDNTATVKVGNDYTSESDPVEIPVTPDDPKKPEKKANVAEGATVKVGDEIEYTISYKNHLNQKANVVVTDKLDEGVDFVAAENGTYDAATHTVTWTFENVAPYDGGEVKLTVKVNENAKKIAADETTATVDNTASVKVGNDYTSESDPVEIPVTPDDPKKPEKKANVAADATVKVGDEIEYTISYKNHLNTKANVVVTDKLDEGVDFVKADGATYDKASHTVTWTFENVAPYDGGEVKLTVKVNENARKITADETTATVDNTASVKVGNDYTSVSDPVEIPVTPDEPTNPTKKADDKALNSFGKIAVGDELPFTVSYVNHLNTVATVTVKDTLEEGLTFVSADNGGTYDEATRTVTWVIKDVAPFTSGSVKVITVVNENAIDAADPTVVNSAVVKIGDQPEQTTEPAEVTVYNPEFSVEKTLTNLPAKGYFTAGETATFDITVKNTGNVPLKDVTVSEQLSGATILEDAAYATDGSSAVIAALPVGEQVVVKAEYTVTEADLGNKELANVVTAKGTVPTDPDDPDKPHDPEDKGDEEPIPTDDFVDVTGSKTWNDGENAFATRPESITLRLLANGIEKLVAETNAEAGWSYAFNHQPKHDADGNEVVYTVTEDAVAGYDATYAAEGYDVTNTLKKHTLTIRYWVNEVGGQQAFKTFTREYYYGESYNVVSPTMEGYRPDQEAVTGVIQGDVEVDVVYTAILWRLNIRYRRVGDGRTLAPMYTNGKMIIGDAYEIESPVIPGYTADRLVVKGEMKGRNMSFTVWYTPEQTEVVIVDEETPFGLGNVVMNAGDCFE